MGETFESGALLGHIYTLADGASLRLRLARTSDLGAITGLLAGHGVAAPRLEAWRLVHFDPRGRYVVCATRLIDGSETLLGVGAVGLDSGAAEPEILIAEAPEVGTLLRRTLIQTADSIGRYRAA